MAHVWCIGATVAEATPILIVRIADVGGGRLDGRDDGAGRFIDEAAGLGSDRLGAYRFGHSRPHYGCIGLLTGRYQQAVAHTIAALRVLRRRRPLPNAIMAQLQRGRTSKVSQFPSSKVRIVLSSTSGATPY